VEVLQPLREVPALRGEWDGFLDAHGVRHLLAQRPGGDSQTPFYASWRRGD
jgi:hypothetical protein